MTPAELESRLRLGDHNLGQNLTFRITLGGKAHAHIGTLTRALCGRDCTKVNKSTRVDIMQTFAHVAMVWGFDRVCTLCVRAICRNEIYQ